MDEWLQALRDQKARARILVRLRRLSLGLEGDWKAVGEGVRELRIPEGKGYRIYYAWDDNGSVVILCGGDKTGQRRDVAIAKEFWRDYRGR